MQKFDINKLRVASPCSAGWESMTGNDRVRHCHACQLNIYNTAEMSNAEVQHLIETRESRLCIRMYRRTDGTVLTNDCPVGLRASLKRAARFAGAALTAMLGLFSISFGQRVEKQTRDASKVEIKRTANEKQDSKLVGTVLDPNGAVIPGAKIKLFKESEKKPIRVKSNDDGDYNFVGLTVGVYRLEVRSSGFKTYIVKEIKVNQSETISLKLILSPASETVTVGIYAEEPLIDVTSSSVTTVITRRRVESLPQ